MLKPLFPFLAQWLFAWKWSLQCCTASHVHHNSPNLNTLLKENWLRNFSLQKRTSNHLPVNLYVRSKFIDVFTAPKTNIEKPWQLLLHSRTRSCISPVLGIQILGPSVSKLWPAARTVDIWKHGGMAADETVVTDFRWTIGWRPTHHQHSHLIAPLGEFLNTTILYHANDPAFLCVRIVILGQIF